MMGQTRGRRSRALGLISGTSMDGVDLALLETDGTEILAWGPTGFVPYTDDDRMVLRQALDAAPALTDRMARPGPLAAAERCVTERHVEAVSGFLAQHGVDPSSLDVVGFHGQTVLHRPEQALTIQIGDGAELARRVGIDVMADMRAADMRAGGQGAPLVPAFHQALVRAAGLAYPVMVLNIGGVSNVTFLSGPDEDPIACDTGPGNALIDDLMLERTGQPLDRDGAASARGRIDEAVLTELLSHPFFGRPAPKSLDRNAFSRRPTDPMSTEDAAATLTALTAAGIARILPLLPGTPRNVIVCGGGARNPTLMAELGRRLPCPVSTAEQHGWIGDAIEAQAFAFLAVRALDGRSLTYPSTTGVRAPVTGGVLHRA